jgi:hypothetical protein
MDADSGRSGPLGRDDSGIFHFSDYRVLPGLYVKTPQAVSLARIRVASLQLERRGKE